MNPFRSLTVLSLEQATTLPYMTLRLAEDGMRVIRLEAPPRGDPNRWVGPEVLPHPDAEPGHEPAMNAYYLPNNLQKESITLNLASERGRQLLIHLIEELHVDIFATNQRPRSYAKLGIDYETLVAVRPDLIWVGITGFGPQSDEAAYDPILQARAGFMALTGDPEGEPTVFGIPMVDLGAGEHTYSEVMKALYCRQVTGNGRQIEVSMYQSAVSWLVSPIMLSRSFEVHVTRQGNTNRFFAPASTFQTADGFVYLAVGNDRQWEAIVKLPGFEGLRRPEYVHNAGRISAVKTLNRELEAITRARTAERLIGEFTSIGVPISQVNELPDVSEDPLISQHLVRARDPRSGIEIAIPPPAVISEYLKNREMMLDFPPRLGEHNASVWGGLGYDVDELKDQGLI